MGGKQVADETYISLLDKSLGSIQVFLQLCYFLFAKQERI